MSRIGKKIIELPKNVNFLFEEGVVTVSCNGKSMSLNVGLDFDFIVKDSIIEVKRSSDDKEIKSKHGLYRSLVFNMIEGLSKGYTKELELHGVVLELLIKVKN